MNTSKNKLLEWSGVITAIIYSILVALNIGAAFVREIRKSERPSWLKPEKEPKKR